MKIYCSHHSHLVFSFILPCLLGNWLGSSQIRLQLLSKSWQRLFLCRQGSITRCRTLATVVPWQFVIKEISQPQFPGQRIPSNLLFGSFHGYLHVYVGFPVFLRLTTSAVYPSLKYLLKDVASKRRENNRHVPAVRPSSICGFATRAGGWLQRFHHLLSSLTSHFTPCGF